MIQIPSIFGVFVGFYNLDTVTICRDEHFRLGFLTLVGVSNGFGFGSVRFFKGQGTLILDCLHSEFALKSKKVSFLHGYFLG